MTLYLFYIRKVFFEGTPESSTAFFTVYLEKVICRKLLQVNSIEVDKLQFCTLLLPVTFLLANILPFSQQFRNQHKILSFVETHIQIL